MAKEAPYHLTRREFLHAMTSEASKLFFQQEVKDSERNQILRTGIQDAITDFTNPRDGISKQQGSEAKASIILIPTAAKIEVAVEDFKTSVMTSVAKLLLSPEVTKQITEQILGIGGQLLFSGKLGLTQLVTLSNNFSQSIIVLNGFNLTEQSTAPGIFKFTSLNNELKGVSAGKSDLHNLMWSLTIHELFHREVIAESAKRNGNHVTINNKFTPIMQQFGKRFHSNNPQIIGIGGDIKTYERTTSGSESAHTLISLEEHLAELNLAMYGEKTRRGYTPLYPTIRAVDAHNLKLLLDGIGITQQKLFELQRGSTTTITILDEISRRSKSAPQAIVSAFLSTGEVILPDDPGYGLNWSKIQALLPHIPFQL